MTSTTLSQPAEKTEKTENPLFTIVFNIVLPALILSKLSAPTRLGPNYALILALSLPLAYGIYDFFRRRKANVFAILGFASILLTGSFGLFHLDGRWFAYKEALIPSLLGIAVLASLKTKSPLVRAMLFNDKVIDVMRVERELEARGNVESFNQLLVRTTWLLAASFLVSAALNFTLATLIIKSPPGSTAFNEELGKMTAVSYPVVVVPCMIITLFALWRLMVGIKRMTGLDLEAIFKSQPPKKK